MKCQTAKCHRSISQSRTEAVKLLEAAMFAQVGLSVTNPEDVPAIRKFVRFAVLLGLTRQQLKEAEGCCTLSRTGPVCWMVNEDYYQTPNDSENTETMCAYHAAAHLLSIDPFFRELAQETKREFVK